MLGVLLKFASWVLTLEYQLCSFDAKLLNVCSETDDTLSVWLQASCGLHNAKG